jgi:hypothetical protein
MSNTANIPLDHSMRIDDALASGQCACRRLQRREHWPVEYGLLRKEKMLPSPVLASPFLHSSTVHPVGQRF